MPDVAKSVGYGGRNNKADVLVVQRLLNNFTTGMGINAVAVDGGFGDETGKAIKKFQARILNMPQPDGRVDPGGRTIRALNATAPQGPAADPANLSGAAWWHANQARYANSDRIADLTPDFATKVQKFIDAMRAGGAQVRVSSTRRNKIRAYLMHYSWRLAAGDVAAKDIPPEPGCTIVWTHPTEAQSQAAAREMRDAGGTLVAVPPPRSGDINARLHQLGAGYGVIKLLSDKPHWSTDGH